MTLRLRGGITEIGSEPEGCPPSSIAVSPGGLTQAVLSGGGPNATFCLEPGTYRQTSTITPLAGQRIVSRLPRQALINGCTLHPASNFTFSAGRWFIGGQTQQGTIYADAAGQGQELGRPEQVFFDDAPLIQVATLAELSSGEFFFDYTANEIWIADNPSGHQIEIGKDLELPFSEANDNVTLEGLVVEKWNTYARSAAIRLGDGWTVSDCESRFNYGTAFSIRDGDNQVLEDSRGHDCRFAGIIAQ